MTEWLSNIIVHLPENHVIHLNKYFIERTQCLSSVFVFSWSRILNMSTKMASRLTTSNVLQTPIQHTEQHWRALCESKLITPASLYTELASYESSELLGNVEGFYGQVWLCPRQQFKRCPAMDGFHSGVALQGGLHCYLTLPDALVLLLVVTGTKFPLVPLVVLVAEPFTTI